VRPHSGGLKLVGGGGRTVVFHLFSHNFKFENLKKNAHAGVFAPIFCEILGAKVARTFDQKLSLTLSSQCTNKTSTVQELHVYSSIDELLLYADIQETHL